MGHPYRSTHRLLIGVLTLLVLLAPLPTSTALAGPPTQTGHPASTPQTPPTPGPPAWDTLDLGLPEGDTYSPTDVTVDPATGDIYVFGYRTREGPPALVVLDGERGTLKRRVLLPVQPTSGQIVFPPEGGQGLVLAWNDARLFRYDPDSDRLTPWLEDVWTLQQSPDGRTLALVFSDRVALYDRVAGTPLWEAPATPSLEIALADHAILILERLPEGDRLQVRAREDGTVLAEQALSDSPFTVHALGYAADETWLLLVSDEDGLRLEQRGPDLTLQHTAPGLWADRIHYDPAQNRIYLAGSRPQPLDPDRSPYALMALDARDLTLLADLDWPDPAYPTHMAFLPDGIATIHEFDAGDQVIFLDRETLQERDRAILGMRLLGQVAVAPPDWLFVADNHARIWRIRRSTGQADVLGAGTAPLAVDPEGSRIYVNRREGFRLQVVALDPEDGQVLATFPQPGAIAPDPTGNRVYLVDQGVTVYDRAGNLLGRLESTFPPGDLAPGLGPYARNAWVNPVTGGLVVLMNNGVPGSNNANQIRLYPPPSTETALPPDTPLADVPNPDNALDTVAFDPVTGRVFVSFQSFRGTAAVMRLEADGSQPRLLHGRAGRLFLDPATRALFVEGAGVVARLGLDLGPRAFYAGPVNMGGATFSPAERRIYFRAEGLPVLDHVGLTELKPVWPRVGPPLDGLPGQGVLSFSAGPLAEGEIGLLVHTGGDEGGLFLSRDEGTTWYPLALAHPLDMALFTTTAIAPDGTVYFSGSGSFGGEGVLRSLDGGRSWQRLLQGLPDLRAQRIVLPPPSDTLVPGRVPVYITTPTRKLLALSRRGLRWQEVPIPEDVSWLLNSLLVADDGSLFAGRFRRLAGSPDWEAFLDVNTLLDVEWVDAAFSRTRRLYGWQEVDGQRRFVRSDDGGTTWQTPAPGLAFGPDHMFHVSLDQVGSTLYVVDRDFEGIHRLFRSTDGGDHWEVVHPGLAGAGLPRFTSDGRLWFLQTEATGPVIGWLVLDGLTWTPLESGLAPSEIPPVSPLPTPTSPAAEGTRGPGCPELSGEEAFLAQQVPELGCPLGAPQVVFMADQPFQRGRMIWRSDTREILVLHQDGTWQVFPDTFEEGEPESDPSLTPPEGLYQPIRGFGKVWREQLGGPDAAIGWATAPESGRSGRIQAWTGGILIGFTLTDRLILLNDGQWIAVK